MELLARKAQLRLARQGYDLFEQKRSALMEELFRIVAEALEEADSVQGAAAIAQRALARAHATAGTEALQSAALATDTQISPRITKSNVMGAVIPTIEHKLASRSALDRGYSIVGTSLTIDDAASAFETEVNAILLLAGTELRLKRLLHEIQRTSRRLNALEQMLIPRLEAEIRYIETTLDERERSDHFRLKLAKQAIDRRTGESVQGWGSAQDTIETATDPGLLSDC